MPNKVLLYIDSSDLHKTEVALELNGKKKKISRSNKNFSSQALLPIIVEILAQNNVQFNDLTGIKINTGPGSFTGIRVGVSVANMFGWYLGIPVNGSMKQVVSVYSEN